MKIHDVAQGSGAWLSVRRGIATASEFHRIVTPARAELSKQARGYAYQLIAEVLLSEEFVEPESELEPFDRVGWSARKTMERGKELEPAAARLYEFEQEVETKKIGFITTDDGRMGCSPDRVVVGKPIAVEFKCPLPHTHLQYWFEGFGADYVPQVQGQMLIGEFELVDRYSYYPTWPAVLTHTIRDDEYIAKLAQALKDFCEMKDEMMARIRASGFFEERKALREALDEQLASASAEHRYIDAMQRDSKLD